MVKIVIAMLLVIMLSVVISLTWKIFIIDGTTKYISPLILYVLYVALMGLIGIVIGLWIVG